MSVYTYTNKKNVKWYLNTITGKQNTPLYFFSRDERDTGCELPKGYMAVENANTGLPVLRKNK